MAKRIRGCDRSFEPHRTREYGRFSRRPCTFFASLAAAPFSRTHRSRRGLHGADASEEESAKRLARKRKRRQEALIHFDVATMRPLAPLQRDGCLRTSHTFFHVSNLKKYRVAKIPHNSLSKYKGIREKNEMKNEYCHNVKMDLGEVQDSGTDL